MSLYLAFAGGFLLALCCDFRLMTDGKAWCCMNEVGLVILISFLLLLVPVLTPPTIFIAIVVVRSCRILAGSAGRLRRPLPSLLRRPPTGQTILPPQRPPRRIPRQTFHRSRAPQGRRGG